MSPAFASFGEFLAMGGYAFYVWLAVGVTLLALLALAGHSLVQQRAILAEIRRFQARAARVRASREQHTGQEGKHARTP